MSGAPAAPASAASPCGLTVCLYGVLPSSPLPLPPPLFLISHLPSSLSSLQTFAFTTLHLRFARGPSGPPMAGSSTTLWPCPHAGSTSLARTLPKPLSSSQVLGFFSTLAGPQNSLAAQHTATPSQHRLLLLLTQPRDRLIGDPGLRSSPRQPTLASVRARLD